MLELSSSAPRLRHQVLRDSISTQITPPTFGFLPGIRSSSSRSTVSLPESSNKDLSYPCLAILVATHHISNTGHETFTFEMIWASFIRQVERTGSMPVTVDGASVGMIKVPKETMVGVRDSLITASRL